MTTAAKKTAAPKKTASTTPADTAGTKAPEATTSDTTTPDTTPDAGADSNEQGPDKTNSGFVQNFGPGTSNPEVPAENSVRPPATIVNADPAAAPLDPPADSHTQVNPARGHDWSSTDKTYAESGGRSIAGENHSRLLDANGNLLGPDDLFDDPDPIKTVVYTKVEVLEEFFYPNTLTPTLRRVYGKGTPVPRFQAARIMAAAREDAEAAQAAASAAE